METANNSEREMLAEDPYNVGLALTRCFLAPILTVPRPPTGKFTHDSLGVKNYFKSLFVNYPETLLGPWSRHLAYMSGLRPFTDETYDNLSDNFVQSLAPLMKDDLWRILVPASIMRVFDARNADEIQAILDDDLSDRGKKRKILQQVLVSSIPTFSMQTEISASDDISDMIPIKYRMTLPRINYVLQGICMFLHEEAFKGGDRHFSISQFRQYVRWQNDRQIPSGPEKISSRDWSHLQEGVFSGFAETALFVPGSIALNPLLMQ